MYWTCCDCGAQVAKDVGSNSLLLRQVDQSTSSCVGHHGSIDRCGGSRCDHNGPSTDGSTWFACCICCWNRGHFVTVCNHCDAKWESLRKFEQAAEAMQETNNGSCSTLDLIHNAFAARRQVGKALQHRLDLVMVSVLLQTEDGIKALVQEILEGRFHSKCSDALGTTTILSSTGLLDLSFPLVPGGNRANTNHVDARASSNSLVDAGPLFRRKIPLHLHLRSIAASSHLKDLDGVITALDVSGNVRLEFLPIEQLASIRSLVSIECLGCPLLLSPPQEIAALGGVDVLKYVREALMGGRRVSSMHLITLGHQHRFELFDTLMKAESLRVTEQKLGLTLSVQEAEVWDLSSSQDASGLKFTVQHLVDDPVANPLLCIQRAIYVLMWEYINDSTLKSLTHVTESLDMLQLHVPGAQVVLVSILDPDKDIHNGEDKMQWHAQCKHMQEMLNARSWLASPISLWKHGESICIDNRNSRQGLDQLRTACISIAKAAPWWQERIPGSYWLVENAVLERRQEISWLSVKEYLQLLHICGIASRYWESCTRFLHDRSVLKYLGEYSEFLCYSRTLTRNQDEKSVLGCSHTHAMVCLDVQWAVATVKALMQVRKGIGVQDLHKTCKDYQDIVTSTTANLRSMIAQEQTKRCRKTAWREDKLNNRREMEGVWQFLRAYALICVTTVPDTANSHRDCRSGGGYEASSYESSMPTAHLHLFAPILYSKFMQSGENGSKQKTFMGLIPHATKDCAVETLYVFASSSGFPPVGFFDRLLVLCQRNYSCIRMDPRTAHRAVNVDQICPRLLSCADLLHYGLKAQLWLLSHEQECNADWCSTSHDEIKRGEGYQAEHNSASIRKGQFAVGCRTSTQHQQMEVTACVRHLVAQFYPGVHWLHGMETDGDQSFDTPSKPAAHVGIIGSDTTTRKKLACLLDEIPRPMPTQILRSYCEVDEDCQSDRRLSGETFISDVPSLPPPPDLLIGHKSEHFDVDLSSVVLVCLDSGMHKPSPPTHGGARCLATCGTVCLCQPAAQFSMHSSVNQKTRVQWLEAVRANATIVGLVFSGYADDECRRWMKKDEHKGQNDDRKSVEAWWPEYMNEYSMQLQKERVFDCRNMFVDPYALYCKTACEVRKLYSTATCESNSSPCSLEVEKSGVRAVRDMLRLLQKASQNIKSAAEIVKVISHRRKNLQSKISELRLSFNREFSVLQNATAAYGLALPALLHFPGGDKMRTGTELDFSRDEVQQLEELMGRHKFFSHVVATYRLTVEGVRDPNHNEMLRKEEQLLEELQRRESEVSEKLDQIFKLLVFEIFGQASPAIEVMGINEEEYTPPTHELTLKLRSLKDDLCLSKPLHEDLKTVTRFMYEHVREAFVDKAMELEKEWRNAVAPDLVRHIYSALQKLR